MVRSGDAVGVTRSVRLPVTRSDDTVGVAVGGAVLKDYMSVILLSLLLAGDCFLNIVLF